MTREAGNRRGNLAAGQAGFVKTLQQGPSALPKGLFSGTHERVLLGLKTHANTISHARLVALEETFPRLRARLGEARFNALCRVYIERPDVMRCSLQQIGASFPDYLTAQETDPQSVDLARIEWQWLESYHAPDATILTMADIAGLDEAGLLGLEITEHPSLRLVRLAAGIAPELPEIIAPGVERPHAMMICRLQADVRLMPINAEQCGVVEALQENSNMGNLLAFALEICDEASALPLIFGLIDAGAICKRDDLVFQHIS